MRTGIRHIALREWGLEEYSSVENGMVEEIIRLGVKPDGTVESR
jgi:hypothetical protein